MVNCSCGTLKEMLFVLCTAAGPAPSAPFPCPPPPQEGWGWPPVTCVDGEGRVEVVKGKKSLETMTRLLSGGGGIVGVFRSFVQHGDRLRKHPNDSHRTFHCHLAESKVNLGLLPFKSSRVVQGGQLSRGDGGGSDGGRGRSDGALLGFDIQRAQHLHPIMQLLNNGDASTTAQPVLNEMPPQQPALVPEVDPPVSAHISTTDAKLTSSNGNFGGVTPAANSVRNDDPSTAVWSPSYQVDPVRATSPINPVVSTAPVQFVFETPVDVPEVSIFDVAPNATDAPDIHAVASLTSISATVAAFLVKDPSLAAAPVELVVVVAPLVSDLHKPELSPSGSPTGVEPSPSYVKAPPSIPHMSFADALVALAQPHSEATLDGTVICLLVQYKVRSLLDGEKANAIAPCVACAVDIHFVDPLAHRNENEPIVPIFEPPVRVKPHGGDATDPLLKTSNDENEGND
ncbi:hypothetical protein Taro_039006 [Colocasia esculenta]|uniref:Uncharacterized protein n=1 Tax=Colocasia esculenta TaxID=4460 RepID=A0A843WQA0_COLES|nr:hypothetical protein [Colocasia esculenta]